MLFHLIVIQLHTQYISTIWPSSNNSNIQLLGLFPDMDNISKSSTFSVHSRAMFKAVILLSHRYDIRIRGELIQWQTIQTAGDIISALDSMCQAISSSIIVGSGFSRDCSTVAAFAERVGIPIAEYATNNIYSNLTLVDTDFDKSSYGIVMPKQASYIQDVDVCILSLQELGVLKQLRIKWFQ
ncbi:unnamed protein product [Adineta steineri]|uniref:Uncharacterized protein n=1 Tax=Adineta steineri TaxID=433720 RepID=A0A814HJA4_9BILA|nr:unnamed protein product [Adineta steineri]CAF1087865.1 unnamed protein product [Adineta steineri]